MGRGRGITLKGEAARAFIEGAMGKPLKEDRKELNHDDKRLVIATKISMLMRSGTVLDSSAATSILLQLEREGLEAAYELSRKY